MKVLFSKEGNKVYCADEDKMIVCIDGVFYDKNGNETQPVKSAYYPDDYDDNWYQEWMDYEEVETPLKAESTIELEWEIDDAFGNYGFKNETGEFVIEPQYAYANDFTKGLACVNLNRTWYRTKEGRKYYENHYGYIDANGKTIIEFKYDEAYPFNKYGVALVSDLKDGWRLIDTEGNELPGTNYYYISLYDYEKRFLEFAEGEDELCGIYDTKERKVLLPPSITSMIEWEEDCILIYKEMEENGVLELYKRYINDKGELLYQWAYGKGFTDIEIPDKNNVTAVGVRKIVETNVTSGRFIERNGKKYRSEYVYGLYSSKEMFLLLMEYDEIKKMGENVWACHKDGVFTFVETEETD